MILDGLRNFFGGGLNTPNPPLGMPLLRYGDSLIFSLFCRMSNAEDSDTTSILSLMTETL